MVELCNITRGLEILPPTLTGSTSLGIDVCAKLLGKNLSKCCHSEAWQNFPFWCSNTVSCNLICSSWNNYFQLVLLWTCFWVYWTEPRWSLQKEQSSLCSWLSTCLVCNTSLIDFKEMYYNLGNPWQQSSKYLHKKLEPGIPRLCSWLPYFPSTPSPPPSPI